MSAAALALRAVSAPGWRWRTGMVLARLDPDEGDRIVVIGEHMQVKPVQGPDAQYASFPCVLKGDPHRHGRSWISLNRDVINRWLPDLTNAATLGCLLALVREAWGDPRLVAIYCEAANPGQSEGWAVQRADNRLPLAGEHPSEAEALVAALEAAPPRVRL